MPKPIRWFTIPQLFRYERPQRGRLREHFQLNMDIVGGTGVAADAEVVAAAVDCLRALGLGSADIVARVSDRQLIRGVLLSLGFGEDGLLQAFAALDRMDKESEEWVVERLCAAGGDENAARRVLALSGSTLDEIAGDYGSSEEVRESVERLGAFFAHMTSYGLGEYVEFDPRLVRGLAYYTGLVFEVWERSGQLRAVCGGGRYDDLLESLGGTDLPAAGFGMGDVVLGELLKDRGLVPEPPQPVEDFVIVVSPEVRPLALELVRGLREAGRRVSFDLGERAVGKQFKAANQAGAVRAIIIGPDEAARGVVRVREMESGEETEMKVESLARGRLRLDS